MIRFRCKECGKKLKADEDIIGRKVKCTSCDNVEYVPPSDDLTKPESPEKIPTRLAANKPKATAHSKSSIMNLSADDSSGDDSRIDDSSVDESLFGYLSANDSLLGNDSRPIIEMSGPSSDGPREMVSQLPFQRFERRKSDFKQFFPIALGGLAIVGIVLLAINAGWLFNSGPKFKPEFEALPAVTNYRRAQKQLDKSRRVMMVMGEGVISKKSLSQELIDEMHDLNESILALTKNTKTLVEASKLVEQGEERAANKLLTDEANMMNDRKLDVDRKMEQYNDLSYKS